MQGVIGIDTSDHGLENALLLARRNAKLRTRISLLVYMQGASSQSENILEHEHEG
jgi:hypothetical protein